MRPPAEVNFFTPCLLGNFQKFLNPVCYTIKWKIDKFVIFISVICHRRSDTNSRIIFFLYIFKFLTLRFSFAWTHNHSADSRFKILCPTVLSNRAIIIFYKLKSFKKYFLRVSAISKMPIKRSTDFPLFQNLNFIFFCECSDFENKKGSGNISPPSRFVHLPGVQNLSLRPPTEVKFFTPCHFWNFQKFLMSRKIQIDESVIFVSVICHRWCSDTNWLNIFFLCTSSNFLLWDFLMPWLLSE